MDTRRRRGIERTIAGGRSLFRKQPETRYWLDRLASETGLRMSELRSLERGSFDLDADPPAVTVAAAYAKNRRADTLPLRRATARALAPWLRDHGDGQVFVLPHWALVIGAFRADLAAARSEWIGYARSERDKREREESSFLRYQDAVGRFADFHALRHTFITGLARAGVHPKLAQDLARHSTINLTMSVYSHSLLTERADAVEVLPDVGHETKRVTNTA